MGFYAWTFVFLLSWFNGVQQLLHPCHVANSGVASGKQKMRESVCLFLAQMKKVKKSNALFASLLFLLVAREGRALSNLRRDARERLREIPTPGKAALRV